MSIVLKNQVEASERSVEELRLKIDQDRATICMDIQALMESVRDIYRDINHYVERWQAKNIEGDRWNMAAIFGLYIRLDKSFGGTADLIGKLETKGYQFEGQVAFTNAWRDLKTITCFSPEGLEESFAQIRRGETSTLAELENEIRGGAQ